MFTVLNNHSHVFCFCLLCQFMSDARDCESYLRQLQETIKRQYTCDKNSRLSKLEDLLQDSMVSIPFSFYLKFSELHWTTFWLLPKEKKWPLCFLNFSYTTSYNSVIPQMFYLQ